MPVVVLWYLLVAIAFGRAGHNSSSAPGTSIAVTVTINAGETGVCCWEDTGGSGGITSISGGGTWTKRSSNNYATGNVNTELWTTDAGAATAASSVTANFNGTPAAVAVVVAAYTGVGSLGAAATPAGVTQASPSISLTTQDSNNWVVAAIGGDDGSDGAYVANGAGVTLRDEGLISSLSDAHVGLFDNTSVSPGPVSNGVTYPLSDYSLVAFELRSTSQSTTYYLNNPIQGSSNAGLLDAASPTASTSTTGWTVGATTINQYSRQTYNTEVATTGFTGTAQPSGSPVNLGEDCYRSAVTSGTFSAGTWYSSLSVIGVSSGGIQQGRGRFRLWRSTNADGTGATEITQGTMIGSQVTELNTSVAQSSSASTQIGSLVLSNEYLFYQIGWETL